MSAFTIPPVSSWDAILSSSDGDLSKLCPPYSGAHPQHQIVALVQDAIKDDRFRQSPIMSSPKGPAPYFPIEELMKAWGDGTNIPNDVSDWVCDLTRHFARVTKSFSPLDNGWEAANDILKLVLFSPSDDQIGKIIATKRLDDLSKVMKETWDNNFTEGEKEMLVLVPSENDEEPATVGFWKDQPVFDEEREKKKRFTGWGKGDIAMLRPSLRQKTPIIPRGYRVYSKNMFDKAHHDSGPGGANKPCEGGHYVPGDRIQNIVATGDPDGNLYVEEFLIPESKRILPLLNRMCDDVAASVPGVVVYVPPLKTLARMSEKMAGDHKWHEYPKQASNVDVARIMLKVDTPTHLLQALAEIKERGKVVRLKNRFGNNAGVKDMLLNLIVDDIYCEIQIGLNPLIEVRRQMHKFYGLVRSEGPAFLEDYVKELP